MRVVDFGAGSPPWTSIDDVVMGGVSSSSMTVENGVAVFSGVVSLDNGGGFASVRSPVETHDLSAHNGLLLRIRGDGKRYKLRLRTTEAFDGVSYQAAIDPPTGRWCELSVPFVAFDPVFRGRRVSGHPPLDPAAVRSVGLLIADGQEGPFRLELAWIEATAGAED